MGHLTERRASGSRRTRALVLVITTLLLLAALAVGAGAAFAGIYDEDATPSWSFYVDGPAGDYNDTAADVAKTATATWVVGQSQGLVTNLDASLFRVPTASSAAPVMHTWDSLAHQNDANYAVAARGSYVYSAGATRNAKNNLDLMVIRWASTTGAFKWVRRFAGPAGFDDLATDVVIDGSGNVIVCGTSENVNNSTYWVVRKYTAAGDLKWTFTYDGSDMHADRPAEMFVDTKNNIYVTGYSRQVTASGLCTIKLSPTGTRLWTRKYRGPDYLGGAATAIARRPAGGVYVGGYVVTADDGTDAVLVHYTAAGDRRVYSLYTAQTVAPTVQTINDIALASNGQIIGVGQHNDQDPLWVLWDTDGGIDDADFDVTANIDYWKAVGADAYGGVYLTGPYDNASINPNIRTMRMSVLPGGGRWLYDDDGNGLNREVAGLAVSGLSCAVAGRQYMDPDYDQFLHIWTY
jgi:hypothetical protein